MWIKDLIEDILSPVYPGIDLQEVRSVGVNRLDNDGILPVYAAAETDRQSLAELVEQEGRETNIETQQLVFIRGDFGRFLQLFGTDPVLLDWDGNNFTIEFNVARWPDWFSIKIINEDITMPINTPIYYLDANGIAVPVGENAPMPVSEHGSAAITPVDISSTITSGGTAQTLIDAVAGGQTVYIKNDSTGNLWFNETGVDAVQDSPSHLLEPGDSWTSDRPIATAVSIIGATTGQKFTARKW